MKKIAIAGFCIWYLGTGLAVENLYHAQLQLLCPGHVTAHDRWPMAVSGLYAVAWPLAIINAPMFLLADLLSHRVCDRFD